ncbi:NAD(P)/FAD-dependent oxidoreductase [Thermodesulfobacteriota bacterium]
MLTCEVGGAMGILGGTIRIAGSGPAGMTAAINLARAGFPVTVYEKHGDSGQRFHGDMQGLENWSVDGDIVADLQAMGLAINFDCHPFSALTVSNGSRIWNFACARPAFYLVKRGDIPGSLDQGLKQQAEALGVTIRYRSELPVAEADIIATGPLPHHLFAMARGEIFTTGMADIAYGLVNDAAAFKGYSYLLVSKGYGCLCTVLFDRFGEINNCFEATREMFGRLVSLEMKTPRPVGGLGSFAAQPVLRRGASLCVGEAAGLQDLLWGFGMRSAITSGFLAAESIITNTDYAAAAQSFFGDRLRASIVNRYLWERFGGDNYQWLMDRINRAGDPLAFLHSFHNFNLAQRLLYPLARRFVGNRYPGLMR